MEKLKQLKFLQEKVDQTRHKLSNKEKICNDILFKVSSNVQETKSDDKWTTNKLASNNTSRVGEYYMYHQISQIDEEGHQQDQDEFQKHLDDRLGQLNLTNNSSSVCQVEYQNTLANIELEIESLKNDLINFENIRDDYIEDLKRPLQLPTIATIPNRNRSSTKFTSLELPTNTPRPTCRPVSIKRQSMRSTMSEANSKSSKKNFWKTLKTGFSLDDSTPKLSQRYG